FSIRPLVGRSEPTLLAYFSHQPISQNLEFAVADENGFYSARSSGVILQSTDFPENVEVLGREFPAFPRRGNYFFLNVYSNRHEGGLEKLGQWKLRNPARQEYPIWKGEPFPVHRSVDGVDFFLTRLLLNKPS